MVENVDQSLATATGCDLETDGVGRRSEILPFGVGMVTAVLPWLYLGYMFGRDGVKGVLSVAPAQAARTAQYGGSCPWVAGDGANDIKEDASLRRRRASGVNRWGVYPIYLYGRRYVKRQLPNHNRSIAAPGGGVR